MDKDDYVKFHIFPLAQESNERGKEFLDACLLAFGRLTDRVKLAWYAHRYPDGDTDDWVEIDGLVYPVKP